MQKLQVAGVLVTTVLGSHVATPAASAEVSVWVKTDGFAGLLDEATTASSTSAFSPTEKQQVQDKILSELNRIYAGYNITFNTTEPVGNRHTIDLGATHASFQASWGATTDNGLGNYVPNGVANVYTKNFGAGIIPGLPANNRPGGLGIEMGLIAAHELGHIMGLQHWHKFGAASITPATYTNTGDAPYSSVMSVPVSPYGKANYYNLNRFERAIFDIAGGTSLGGRALVDQPVLEVSESGDAGNVPLNARPLPFGEGESSQMRLAMNRGKLDHLADDVDVYTFTTTSAGLFTCNVFSGSAVSIFEQNKWFNPRLRLLAEDGVTVIAEFDNLHYDSSVINVTSYVDFSGTTINVRKQVEDPFMLNVPIDIGTYYLEISAVSDNQLGDAYQFLAAFDGTVAPVPEPTGAAAVLVLIGLAARRRPSRA